MKFLLIGSDYTWSIERIYRRELEDLGHSVELISVQNMFYDYYYKSLFHKLIFLFGLSTILNTINKNLYAKVANEYYDIIWIFKGMEIFPETLKKLKAKTKNLINYNPDNPFIFSGVGSGNLNIKNSITLYDLHLTYDAWIKEQIESKFKIKTEILPFGFDEKAIADSELNNVEEVLAVCFLGNPDSYRAPVIKSLLRQGVKVHLYGNNWEKYIQHNLAEIHQPVYGLDFYKTLRKYRVQLNIMRVHNLNSHNMRSIEIPGAGGVMLAPKTLDHLAFFETDKEIFIYEGNASLALEAKRILNFDKSAIDILRVKARNKVLEQFTYKTQTKRILSLLNEA